MQGTSTTMLEETLAFLQREGFNFVSLKDVIHRIEGKGPPLNKAVCFTMDDGFLDQATIAAPIFEKYDCPVTIFLITDFLDGKLWPWDDQVRYMFDETSLTELAVKVGQQTLRYDFSKQSRNDCARAFREVCKTLPEEEMINAIESLSLASNIKITKKPPESYQPMSWDTVRNLEKRGIVFGTHGLSHRIISRMASDKVKKEVDLSWQRLKQELLSPLKVFCFSTGRFNQDFTVRDINTVKSSGFKAALSTDPGYIRFENDENKEKRPFVLNRFTLPDNKSQLIQYCSGIEQAKDILRRQTFEQIHKKYGGKKGYLKYHIYRSKYLLGGYREQSNINWCKVSRLIFICKGNICRSPFAEAVARKMCVDTISFGVDTRGGDSANPRATSIAREFDIDLTRHKTTRIEEYIYQKGDLIVAMEPEHIKVFNIKLSSANTTQKTLLGLWESTPHPYIHDPYSADDDYFRECFYKIQGATEDIVMRVSG